MDLAILGRAVPALAAAVAVAWAAARPWDVPPGRAADEVLRGAIVGLVAARIGWLLLAGPDVWRTAGVTVLLLRAGVETVLGGAVAAAWLWRSSHDDAVERAVLLTAGPAAALAGLAVWHATCAVEQVCAGIPASWGVRLPGYVSTVVPVGYLEGAVAGLLAVAAWRLRDRWATGVALLGGYTLARAGLAFVKAPLVGLPTRDQLLSAVAAVGLGLVALRLRGASPEPRSGEALDPQAADGA
jgi:hypothetical protein